MDSHQIRRLVVLNKAGNLTGILSLGDVAGDCGAKQVGVTLEDISAEPADASVAAQLAQAAHPLAPIAASLACPLPIGEKDGARAVERGKPGGE